MLRTCVASTDVDLTTTGALKQLIFGATATSTAQDAYLSLVIRRASKWAETYVGYPLTLQTYQETVASYGMRELVLSRTPISAVDRVFDSSDTGTASQVLSSEFRVEDPDAGFLSRDLGWAWSATLQARYGNAYVSGGGPAFPLSPEPVPGDEYRPWLVDYRAGYVYGGLSTDSANWSTEKGSTSTGRTLPEDIELAVLIAAQEIFENRNDVLSESLGDVSVTYANRSSAGPDSMTSYEKILAPYRRTV